MVGDTVTDHRTALNAGVPSILVTFGPGANDMVSLGPDALLENFLDLPNLVQNLFR